jgi:hypothetical protein
MKYPLHDPSNPTVCFDFDGVLAESLWPSPRLGKIDVDAKRALLHYFRQGCEIIVLTARPPEHLPLIEEWLLKEGLHVNVYRVTNVKPVASLYFDDRAVRWPLCG